MNNIKLYEKYYYCCRCNKHYLKGYIHEIKSYNKGNGLICPICRHKLRTRPVHRNSRYLIFRGKRVLATFEDSSGVDL